MKLIGEISDEAIIPKFKQKIEIDFGMRVAARTILFNDEDKIALLYVSKKRYHKLPGGGVERGETIKQALKREVMEEAGCDIEIMGELGKIIEKRQKHKLIQISYCFVSKVKKNYSKPTFTKKEKSEGFQLKWLRIKDAISLIKKDKTKTYMSKCVNARLKIYLHEVKRLGF